MPCSMMPLPTVAATLRWNTNTATKLKNAARITAWYGLSTRVETTVAIEFAASWKAFMKSKASELRAPPHLPPLLQIVLLAKQLGGRRAHPPVGIGLEAVDLLAALEDRLRAL